MRKLFLLTCLLWLTSVNSEASVQWQKFSYFQNFAGLSDSLSPTEIQDNEASDLQNVVFDIGGAIKKRNGYVTIPSTANYTVSGGTNAVTTGLFTYRPSNGNRYLIVTSSLNNVAANVSIKTYAIGGGLPSGSFGQISGAGVLPATGYTNNNLASFTVASDTLVFSLPNTSGSKPFAWGGSGNIYSLTGDANCPNSSIVVFHKNQLFSNDTAAGKLSKVHFSDLTNGIAVWPVLNFFDVNANDGSQVRGLVSAFNALYIFKDRSIWCLTGDNKDNFVLQKLIDNIGTLSQQSIGVLGNFIYFTTQQGDIAVYDGAYNVQFISAKIRNSIGALNFSRSSQMLGLPFSTYKYTNYDYYVSASLASASVNGEVLVFDTEKKAWTKFIGINANAWCVGDDPNGQNILIFGDYEGYVHYYPSTGYVDGNVHNSAINAYYTTKWFKYSEIALGDKYWRLLKTYVLSETNNSTLTINANSDYQTGTKTFLVSLNQAASLWDVFVWDKDIWGGQNLIIDRQEVDIGTKMFQLKFSNAIAEQGFTVFGWEAFLEGVDRV